MKKIKKTKEVHKHKKKPSNLSAHKAPSEIKISEAILRLSEPLRSKYKDTHHLRGIISATVMAWNISLYSEEEQDNVQDMLIDSLPEELSGEDVATLLAYIDDLIVRKKKYYPNVNDYIVKHDLSISGDDITLTVGSAPINGKIQRKKIDGKKNDTIGKVMYNEKGVKALQELEQIVSSFGLPLVKERKFKGILNALAMQIEDYNYSLEVVEYLGKALVELTKSYHIDRYDEIADFFRSIKEKIE